MSDFQNDVMAVRERINRMLKDKGITQNAVAAGDAPAQKRINSQLSHGAALSVDTLLRVLAACPDISADWLLRGTGDPGRRAEAKTGTGQETTLPGSLTGTLSENFVRDLLAEKDRQIQTLLSVLEKQRDCTSSDNTDNQ